MELTEKVYKEALKYYNENVSVVLEAFPIVKIYTKTKQSV
jgi:hypothetical protein